MEIMAILISPGGEIPEFCSHIEYRGETSLIKLNSAGVEYEIHLISIIHMSLLGTLNMLIYWGEKCLHMFG